MKLVVDINHYFVTKHNGLKLKISAIWVTAILKRCRENVDFFFSIAIIQKINLLKLDLYIQMLLVLSTWLLFIFPRYLQNRSGVEVALMFASKTRMIFTFQESCSNSYVVHTFGVFFCTISYQFQITLWYNVVQGLLIQQMCIIL